MQYRASAPVRRLGVPSLVLLLSPLSLLVMPDANAQSDKRVCVEVAIKRHGEEEAKARAEALAKERAKQKAAAKKAEAGAPPGANTTDTPPESQEPPTESPPIVPPQLRNDQQKRGPIPRNFAQPFPAAPYLKRLLEHYVTHENRFVAVSKGCDETLRVELYPLAIGWTAFARYTGFQQEEKVDKITYDELPRFAERAVLALLYNRRVEQTVDRTNVLRADSEQERETIKGSAHFVTSVGTTLKVAIPGLDTATAADQPVSRQVRLFNTVDIALGYRGSFNTWGLETTARLAIGANQRKAKHNNLLGGHIDHVLDAGLAMQFFWYDEPDAVNSLYYGLGGQLDVSIFEPVAAQNEFSSDSIVGAGLAAVGVLGFEFLRTSNIRPYAQMTLTLPVYVYDAENDDGHVFGWIPGLSVTLGAMF